MQPALPSAAASRATLTSSSSSSLRPPPPPLVVRLPRAQAPRQRAGSCRSSSRVRMFPRGDSHFASQQLSAMVAELQADAELAPLLEDASVAAAIRDIAADPARVQRYTNNAKVMRVLERLLGRDMRAKEAAAFAEASTSPGRVLAAMTADEELSRLLASPLVRRALADIRAHPAAGMARWGSQPQVSRALDLLECVLGGGGPAGQVVDVVAEEVLQQRQLQQHVTSQH